MSSYLAALAKEKRRPAPVPSHPGPARSQPVAVDGLHPGVESRPRAHFLREFVDVPLFSAPAQPEGAGDDRVGGAAGEQVV
jgi:hypothetical protein